MEWISGSVTAPRGFRAAGVRCGVKSQGKDLALIVSDVQAVVAGMFTTNRAAAPCVRYSRHVIEAGIARAIVANSGNANAATGEEGFVDNVRMAQKVAQLLECPPAQVVTASTGIIGRRLPVEKIEAGIEQAMLQLSPDGGSAAAEAIMTTDTAPKAEALRLNLPGGEVRIGGIAKGAGMIAPNMATMLCFLTTDAQIAAPALQQVLKDAVERSFHCLTIDSDTSTNDMVVILANGQSGVDVHPYLDDFQMALESLCVRLAQRIARDGEGATKLVEIEVRGAPTFTQARQMAKTVAESPLVKTALFGNDPNWGRILAAMGRSGVDFDPDRAHIALQDTLVYADGKPTAFDAQDLHERLKAEKVTIAIDLQQGTEHATVWTCDFSYDYVRINAEYST
ncbi:MAG: bifunctional glutamate N-acetyltransferase/amino-acid acetyltransferase ArgJ [Armatimonadota bacterium]|nr:bifunctional glutamate N-acetyltransferase/amino-acid acetyltransferase ArgJ [bacterium]MDW8320203.1 bifunctional glutamate N-acetyltransferase/amino-acid acetyltransferase ArgJ [Armatimonadota bacterium]